MAAVIDTVPTVAAMFASVFVTSRMRTPTAMLVRTRVIMLDTAIRFHLFSSLAVIRPIISSVMWFVLFHDGIPARTLY